LTWKLTLAVLIDARHAFPGVIIPDGSLDVYRERIHCRQDGALSYPMERRIVAPDGTLVAKRAYDADVEREKAEKSPNGWRPTVGYHSDPRSLVCWAVARKCDGEDSPGRRRRIGRRSNIRNARRRCMQITTASSYRAATCPTGGSRSTRPACLCSPISSMQPERQGPVRVTERTRSRGSALRAGRSKWRGWR
jgi:hypothetical protein